MICTLPTDLLEKTGSVTNVRTGEQASIIPIISMVEAPTKENDTFHALNRIASFISVIAGIFCLLQFFYLIRNINRGDIFSWKNVKFLRKLGWALILLFICTLATIVIGNYEASQVLQLNGCEFSYTFAFSRCDSHSGIHFIAGSRSICHRTEDERRTRFNHLKKQSRL